MSEFFSRDADSRLHEIASVLYGRLQDLREGLDIRSEFEFLCELLDKMEK